MYCRIVNKQLIKYISIIVIILNPCMSYYIYKQN